MYYFEFLPVLNRGSFVPCELTENCVSNVVEEKRVIVHRPLAALVRAASHAKWKFLRPATACVIRSADKLVSKTTNKGQAHFFTDATTE